MRKIVVLGDILADGMALRLLLQRVVL